MIARFLKIRRVDTDETFEDEADVVVSARGNLSEPSWPNIPGLHDFSGMKMHSARWNEG
jgi:cation diffusion facilitator CzcD-associated flavoprotein CzcO